LRSDNFEVIFGIAELLLHHGADINLGNRTGYTPLHNACFNSSIELCRFLIDHGADVNIYDDEYLWTPLQVAIDNQDIDICRLLIEKGTNINYLPNDGSAPKSALHIASSNGNIEIARLLLENGANIDQEIDYHSDFYEPGTTSLHFAAIFGHANICELLLDHGADINIMDEADHTPLDVASTDQVRDLLNAYITFNRRSALLAFFME
jgi:ankyrin repeat protein